MMTAAQLLPALVSWMTTASTDQAAQNQVAQAPTTEAMIRAQSTSAARQQAEANFRVVSGMGQTPSLTSTQAWSDLIDQATKMAAPATVIAKLTDARERQKDADAGFPTPKDVPPGYILVRLPSGRRIPVPHTPPAPPAPPGQLSVRLPSGKVVTIPRPTGSTSSSSSSSDGTLSKVLTVAAMTSPAWLSLLLVRRA
jgi:hypothetical protein